MADYDLPDIKGVSDSRADKLRDAGFVTVDDVATADPDALTEVSGIGNSTADGLIESAQDLIKDTVEDDPDDEEEADDDEDEVEPISQDEMDDLVETDTGDDEDDKWSKGTEDDPWDDEAIEEELEELEDELEDEEPEEGYPVAIDLKSHDHYDHFYYTLIDLRHGRFNMTASQRRLADQLLDCIRPLNGTGKIELPLSREEMNALHAALTQTTTDYQGRNDMDAFEAVRDVKRQVQAAREEYIL